MLQATEKDTKEAKEKKCCPVCKGQRFWRSLRGTQKFEFDENGRVFWRDAIDKEPMNSKFDIVICRICKGVIPSKIWEAWFKKGTTEAR